MYTEEIDDYLEFIAYKEEKKENGRISKRYLRDNDNPLEFWSAEEFRERYRFNKETVIDTIVPLVQEELVKTNNRGLPITPLLQVLICLRFYGSAYFQVLY